MFSRPEKLNHLETIIYEVDMLDYCYEKLKQGRWNDRREGYVYLEGFLLHYRNIVEFFGNDGDLKVSEWQEWSPKKLTDAEVASLTNRALYNKYFGLISQYLQHCTKRRADVDREWDVEEMYGELNDVVSRFRELFAGLPPAAADAVAEYITSVESVSTASVRVFDSGTEAAEVSFPRSEVKEPRGTK